MEVQDNFVPATETNEAAWLSTSLEKHWSRGKKTNHVAAVIPSGFSAYARIFHPAHEANTRRAVAWEEVARRFGHRAHAQMQWHAITGQGDPYGTPPGYEMPEVGSLPLRQIQTLIGILRRHTESASECYFAVWEGWGSLQVTKQWPAHPTLRLPDRNYYLFKGPIETAAKSISPLSHQSANIWWPKDRAWCVATEIDMMWTYVGGSTTCIEEVIAHPQLEAWQTTLDDRADIQGDQVNMSDS